MRLIKRRPLLWLSLSLLLIGLVCPTGFGQQVVQRGALGRPAQILDETEEWTTPLLVASDQDVEIYIFGNIAHLCSQVSGHRPDMTARSFSSQRKTSATLQA